MFVGAYDFVGNGKLTHWDLSNVAYTDFMVGHVPSFVGRNVMCLNVGKVMSMASMFLAVKFTGKVSVWNTSVVSMKPMVREIIGPYCSRLLQNLDASLLSITFPILACSLNA
jgi:Mycoplasma protein of unknown function, DUF285